MNSSANKRPHLPQMIYGGIALLLLGSGIGTRMAWTSAWAQGLPAQAAAEQADSETVADTKCRECGVVVASRELAQSAGKRYEVTVRMKDGSSRTFTHNSPVAWRQGERLMFIEGERGAKK